MVTFLLHKLALYLELIRDERVERELSTELCSPKIHMLKPWPQCDRALG